MKRYRISAFSRRSGIPADTLRYYEKLGLITSQRQEQNAYRTYDDSDLLLVSQLRMMRSVGIPLMLLAPTENPHTLDNIERHLQSEEAQLAAQIDALEAKLRRVQMLRREFDECKSMAGTCREAEYMETLNLTLPDGEPDDESARIIAAWQGCQPYVHLNCQLDEQTLKTTGNEPMTARLGFGVLAAYAEKLKLPLSPHVVHRPAAHGVRCVLKVRDPLHPTHEELLPLTQYLADTGRTTYGNWSYRIRFTDQQKDGSYISYIAIRVNTRPIE